VFREKFSARRKLASWVRIPPLCPRGFEKPITPRNPLGDLLGHESGQIEVIEPPQIGATQFATIDLGNGKATEVGNGSLYESFFGGGRFYLSTSCAIFANLEIHPSVFYSWHSIR
jgi:hypothetical protein